MKLRLHVFVMLAAVAVISCQHSGAQDESIDGALQAAMNESIKDSGAIGVSAAVMFADGELWAGAAGISHEGSPVTTDMLFDIGSVEKNLQATLCLKLVEDGVIALDDPLEKWLEPTPYIDGGITVRQLLNMTSGIYDFVGDPDSPYRIGYVNIDFDKMWTWEEIQEVLGGKPGFEPGTKSEYSNTNYIVLKHIVEKATQSKQPALLEEMLLVPYGLARTRADFSVPFPETMPIAHGWLDANGDGRASDISGNSINWIASLSPMLVYSTPSDMVKWMDALYHKKAALRPETLRAMLDFVGPVMGEPLMKGYGLGVVDIDLGLIMPRWEQVRVYGHLGSQYGYTTFVGYFPEHGVSLAMMFNRGCDAATDAAVNTVGGAVIDVLLSHVGATESGQGDSVSDLIEKLERSPYDLHLMYEIAKRHQANQDDYEASLVYEEMLKRDPDDKFGYKAEAMFWKAAYDGLIWKKPEGLIAFISEHKDYKDINDAYRFLARTYLRRDEMDKAVQVYHDALEAIGEDADFYNHYAWWVYENRVRSEYKTALRYARTATELKPDAYYIWDTVAWLYSELGEQNPAVEASTKALSLAPEGERAEMQKALKEIKKGST
jgi:D-alanyl-D-alanine carboxypeptidase